jgi:hypothetical protein
MPMKKIIFPIIVSMLFSCESRIEKEKPQVNKIKIEHKTILLLLKDVSGLGNAGESIGVIDLNFIFPTTPGRSYFYVEFYDLNNKHWVFEEEKNKNITLPFRVL